MKMFLRTVTGMLTAITLMSPLSAQTATDGAVTDKTAAAATSGGEKPKAAPSRVANGQRFGAWTVTCEAIAVNETACVLTQRLVRSEGNSFLAEVLAFWSADRSKAYIAARVPNGAYLPSGFAMQVDGSKDRMDFVWQSCSSDLCEALIEVAPDKIETLSNGGEMLAGYRPNLRSEPVVFRLGMDGLFEGLTALK